MALLPFTKSFLVPFTTGNGPMHSETAYYTLFEMHILLQFDQAEALFLLLLVLVVCFSFLAF